MPKSVQHKGHHYANGTAVIATSNEQSLPQAKCNYHRSVATIGKGNCCGGCGTAVGEVKLPGVRWNCYGIDVTTGG